MLATVALDLDLIIPKNRFLHEHSLGRTIDAVSEAFFNDIPIPRPDRQLVARWIAGRPAGYAGTFAPTDHDWCEGVRLFTGETVTSNAGTAHILGEEACRALLLLGVRSPFVRGALARATEGILAKLTEHERHGGTAGLYCCTRCSVAMWRHLAAGGLDDAQRLIPAAMKALRASRDGKGRWRSFPFHYTALALTELAHPMAVTELRYAERQLERTARARCGADKYCLRRRAVAERALAMC